MKILVIGQAPPAVNQTYPYDTTMLYNWLAEIGISKEAAQEMFEWDAVYDKFPGYNSTRDGHKQPTLEQMEDYYRRVLRTKLLGYDKVLVLGAVAKDFIIDKLSGKEYLCLIHPSRRNLDYYRKHKTSILNSLEFFINMKIN